MGANQCFIVEVLTKGLAEEIQEVKTRGLLTNLTEETTQDNSAARGKKGKKE